MANRKVKMILSVGEHEAGKQFSLPAELGDSYIAKGYAEGTLSREFSDEEIAELRSTVQVVSFDG